MALRHPALQDRSEILVFIFACAAIAYLLCGSIIRVGRGDSHIDPIKPVDASQPSLTGTGFAPDAVYLTLQRPVNSLPVYGSWLNSDQSTGVMRSRWYPATKEFSVFVAGGPLMPGNHLSVEVKTGGSGVSQLPVALDENPGDTWRLVDVSLSRLPSVQQFRLVAVDGSSVAGGWIGVSAPFVFRSQNANLFKQLFLVLLATAMDALLLLGPGLVLRAILLQRGRLLSIIWIPVPGLILLTALGLLSWVGPWGLNPRLISRAGVLLLTLSVSAAALRLPLVARLSSIEKRVLATLFVVILIGVAKATYSVGPPGELYRDQISRSLEVGGRSDSRVCYHLIQLIAEHESPFGALATKFLKPWNFSHRGPLAALAAAPLVLAGPIRLDANFPNRPWQIFDDQGFSAYRIAMIVLAAVSLIAVFGLARQFLPDEWALLAFLVAASAPFVLHEIYFTWPKLLSASFVLTAAYQVLQARYFWAGFVLGAAYLCHPSALLCLPGVIALVFLANHRSRTQPATRTAAIIQWFAGIFFVGCGLSIWLAGWRWLAGVHYKQSGFLQYFRQNNNAPTWLEGRVTSIANTLVPLNLYLFHRTHNAVNALGHLSPPIVQFSFAYWTSLPFGAGLALFFCMLPVVLIAALRGNRWLIWIVAVPFLVFAIYWGADSTGLLREGLHAWFLGAMICAVAGWKQFLPRKGLLGNLLRYALLLRFASLSVMLLVVPALSRHLLVQRHFVLSDLCCLAAMLGGSAWLCWQTFRQATLVEKSPAKYEST